MLIDTHVLLWVLTDSDRLGRRAAEAIRRADHVYVSSISILELHIKSMIGELTIPTDLATRLNDEGFTELPLHHRHAEVIVEFDSLTRHDPFDRALLSQARAERIDFVTADDRLLALGASGVVDARR